MSFFRCSRTFCPRLEQLEDRSLLSVSFRTFATPTPASNPLGIAAGPDRNVWFTERAANRIGQITAFGTVTEFPVPTATSGLAGITGGPDANVWFTEADANRIGRITNFGLITEFGDLTSGSKPAAITNNPTSGDLWFTEPGSNKIGTITPQGAVTEFGGLTVGSQPTGITTGSDGKLWFTETASDKIGTITPAGAVTEFGGLTPGAEPTAITAGPDGNLWFTEPGINHIGRISTAGAVTEFPVPQDAGNLGGIAAGPDGNLWYTRLAPLTPGSTGPAFIGRITPAGNVAEFPTISSSQGITAGPNGNMWFTEGTANIGEALLPHYIVSGSDSGMPPVVNVYNAFTGTLRFTIRPFDPIFRGGVRVALGDVTGDGIPDIIVAAGPSGGPEVRVYDGANGQPLPGALGGGFFAFDPNFTGGIFVAAGEFDGDTKADIVVGADAGGGPEVAVFSGADGHQVTAFFAYDPNFLGGVRVAAADVNNDGVDDIITGAGPGGGPNVKDFNGTDFSVLRSFFAYDPNFSGGVYVAGGDVNNDGLADIITGAGAGGGPNVSVFNGDNPADVLQSFFAFDPRFPGGVRVGGVDLSTNGKDDVIAGAGPGGGPQLTVFDSTSGGAVDSFFAYDPSFSGGIFVGGG
jgi:streptogramin lyase